MTATLGELATLLGTLGIDGDLGAPGGVGEAVTVTSLTHDSRQVETGTLFACIPGASFDGHDFAPAAVAAGASALLVERHLDLDLPQLVVPDVRRILGPIACAVYGNPSEQLTVIGVTGTNGKTTIVHLLGELLGRNGAGVEVRGTLTGARTTPEAPELQAGLARAARLGVTFVAMEVSSHALDLHRVDGTRFRVGIFTNLGHDHLDHHGTVEDYYQAKARLFTPELTDLAIVNTDDPAGVRLADETSIDVVRYGLADAENLEIIGPISRFTWRGHVVTLQLAGAHNVSNALAAALAAEAVGMDPVDIADCLCAVTPPRGRFEFVDIGQSFRIAVDYAHTPDALAAALLAARQVAADGKVSLVFGCGGDRDQQKRPEMGRIAVEGADRVYVTSDNPRSENPERIIADVVAGIPGAGSHPAVIVDVSRRSAIRRAIVEAESGDIVLIAGKGHEVDQVIGDQTLPFDDREIAIEALGQRS